MPGESTSVCRVGARDRARRASRGRSGGPGKDWPPPMTRRHPCGVMRPHPSRREACRNVTVTPAPDRGRAAQSACDLPDGLHRRPVRFRGLPGLPAQDADLVPRDRGVHRRLRVRAGQRAEPAHEARSRDRDRLRRDPRRSCGDLHRPRAPVRRAGREPGEQPSGSTSRTSTTRSRRTISSRRSMTTTTSPESSRLAKSW